MRFKNISIVSIVFICLIVTDTFSQVSIATPEQIKNFYKTTTCIVKDGKPFSSFNSYLKEAVEKNWNITKVKFIEEDDFEKQRQNADLSFLILSEATFTEHKQQFKVDVLNIVLGSKGKGLDDMPDLGSVPLCYTNDEADDENYLYKLPAIIKFIQFQIKIIADNNISSPTNLMNYHNGFKSEIKNKMLWLTDKDLSAEAKNENKIKSVYNYNFKIVSEEDLEAAIKRGDDILFAHIVAPDGEVLMGKVWKSLISAKDGKAYFIEEHFSNDSSENGLLLRDFKSMDK